MKITYNEFHTQLLGSRHVDEFRWRALNCERSIWDMFSFDDEGCIYLNSRARRTIDRAEKRNMKGAP